VPDTDVPLKRIRGANETVISYTLNETGTWTIVLEVEDNFGFTYDSTRKPGTDPYRKVVEITIPAGFPIEWILAIVIIVVVLIAVVVLVLRRRRKPITFEE